MRRSSYCKVIPTRFETSENMRSIVARNSAPARSRHAATNRTSAMTVPIDGLPHQLFRTSKFLGLVTSIPTAPTAVQEHSQKIGQCVHIASKTINDCFRDSSIGGPVVCCIGYFIQSSFCPAHTIQPHLPL
jgi:hypothetical protein